MSGASKRAIPAVSPVTMSEQCSKAGECSGAEKYMFVSSIKVFAGLQLQCGCDHSYLNAASEVSIRTAPLRADAIAGHGAVVHRVAALPTQHLCW